MPWIVHLAMTASVSAHVGDIVAGIDAVDPLVDEPLPPILANYGLLLPASDGYVWVCHEAVTEPNAITAPRYARSAEGVWLAALPDVQQGRGGRTLFRSPDGGCSWDDVVGIDAGAQIGEITFDPEDADRALAVANLPSGPNAIYGSTDAGLTWTPQIEPQADRRFFDVGVHEGLGYATATTVLGDAAFWWFEDAAGAWTERRIDLVTTADTRFYLAQRSGDTVWAVLEPPGDDLLVRSPDGGASWTVIRDDLEQISDVQVVGDQAWVTRNVGTELSRVNADGTLAPDLEGFVPAFGLHAEGDNVWFTPLSYAVGPLLTRATLSGEVVVEAYPDDVQGPLACPAGTEVAEVCEPLWAVLEPDLRGFDAPPDEPDDSGAPGDLIDDPFADASSGCASNQEGCGCTSGPSPVAWSGLFLVGIGLLRRRQRL